MDGAYLVIILITTMLSPSTRGRLLQTKNTGSGCFVVSLQDISSL
jgi:hypothetical protein